MAIMFNNILNGINVKTSKVFRFFIIIFNALPCGALENNEKIESYKFIDQFGEEHKTPIKNAILIVIFERDVGTLTADFIKEIA